MKLLLLSLLVASAVARVRWNEIGEEYDFDQYLAKHPKEYDHDSPEYHRRKAIFDSKLASVRSHNSNEEHGWKKGLNEWSDLTEIEFSELFGKKPAADPENMEENLLQEAEEVSDQEEDEEEVSTIEHYFKGLPDHVDWVQQGGMTQVKQQCGGSCWAHTTTEMLESGLSKTYGLKNSHIPKLSVQEVMACTPNPRHCGGAGGCQGATVELAMKWVKKHGLSLEKKYPIGSAKHFAAQMCPCRNICKNNLAKKERVKVKVDSFVTLPKNKFLPLIKAIQEGPVGISVGTTGWQDYDGGILQCSSSANTVIGHAVLLVGYGKTKAGHRFWKIRNSWGNGWGESGYIRMLMRSDEHKFCGKNTKPKEGTGCDGGPKEVPVCGTCGILFDSVRAKGVYLVDKSGKRMSKKNAHKHLKSFIETDTFGQDRDFFSALEMEDRDRDEREDETESETEEQ